MIRILLGTAPISVDLGLLVLRLVSGVALATHGWGKVTDIGPFADGVAQLGFPVPIAFAWAAAISEFFGGIFVAAGLLTRPAALLAATTMAVAVFHAHAGDPFEKREMGSLYLAAFTAIVLMGPGRLALDAAMQGGGRASGGGRSGK